MGQSYVATGEVTALEHELGDDAVEGRTLVTKALLAGAESAEVLGGLGDDIIEKVEVDAARLSCDGKFVSADSTKKSCKKVRGSKTPRDRQRLPWTRAERSC